LPGDDSHGLLPTTVFGTSFLDLNQNIENLDIKQSFLKHTWIAKARHIHAINPNPHPLLSLPLHTNVKVDGTV